MQILETRMVKNNRAHKKWHWLSPEKEPVWFKHLDPIFIETNGEMKLSSCAAETSFLSEQDKEHEEKQNDEEDIFSEADKIDETTSWKVK